MTLKADIDKIMSASDRVYGRNLFIRYRITPRVDAEIKVLVIAPKRQFKKAVTRNRLKRQLREMIRLEKPWIIEAIPAENSLHLAVVYSGPPQMDFLDQKKNFVHALRKVKALDLNNN